MELARPEVPNLQPILAFPSPAAFEAWLETNHDRSRGIWLKINKGAASGSSATRPLSRWHSASDGSTAKVAPVTVKGTAAEVRSASSAMPLVTG